MNKALKILEIKYNYNLFEWCKFTHNDTQKEKDSSVLVIGDTDENFIEPLSKRVKEVYVLAISEEYKEQFEYKEYNKNVIVCPNVVSKTNYKTIVQKFDYVVIVGLMKNMFGLEDMSLTDTISFLIDTFTDKGSVYIAFDNALSFDAIYGEEVETCQKTFCYEDINKAKFELTNKYEEYTFLLYFPMPEYKFPLRIYSEKYLPSLDDENQKIRNLVSLGKFKEYANSYIVLFENKKINNTIYVKYNVDRMKKYAVRTSIIEDENKERQVIKKALYEEANEHIESLRENVEIIKNKSCIILKPTHIVSSYDSDDNKAFAVFPYIEGDILSNVILDKIKNGVSEIDVLYSYMDILIGSDEEKLTGVNLDCVFSNAIVKNNIIYIIDCEWVEKGTVERNFLRYRILKYYYKAFKQYSTYKTFNELINDFDITVEDKDRYEQIETDFQKSIHYNISDLDTDRYYDEKKDPSKFFVLKTEYDKMKKELDSLYITEKVDLVKLKDEHIANLEMMIKDLRREVDEVSKLASYYHKRESIILKCLRYIKNFIKNHLKEGSTKRKIAVYVYRCFRHPFTYVKMLFTKEGRKKIYGYFAVGDIYFENGHIHLPKYEKPLVSIIIPCFNQIYYTYKCLYSIVNNIDTSKISYEVIIADDNSTDKTKKINRLVENIIVSRNDENLGFLKNCNKAEKIAHGEYIYFLNNDTEIKKDTVESLVSLLQSDFTIGMVGSKLIFSDGKLQEAGGIIWSDGSGANYGRGDDKDNFKYNYVREVDYISGCSIMIKKKLFDDIGGFDERYAPAYCEDSDLAFEVRKRGLKVMYQPRSEVVHYEGVSNGTDTNDKNSIKSYQTINNQKLKEKWEDTLINQYPRTANPNFFKARERNFDKKVILFIDRYVPTWDKDAGSKTTFSYIKMFMKKGYIVKFLGDNFDITSPYGEYLQNIGVEVIYGEEIKEHIFDYIKENKKNIDFVYINRPEVAEKYIDFVKENSDAKIIYYGHDLHFMRMRREYEITGDENSLLESKRFKTLELSIIYKADVSYYPSEEEVKEIKNINDNLNVKAINAYMFDKVELLQEDFSKTENLLFVGGFSHKPNEDALLWFDKCVFPLILAKNPNIKLNVVGSNPSQNIIDVCKNKQYNFYGFVSDEELEQIYKKSRIVIVPLRYGAGIKGKIIEAMSKGKAIVTTTCGSEGIFNAKNCMKICDKEKDFANQILKLYDDFNELNNLSYNARKEINDRYTFDKAYEIIKDDFGGK